jgi:hypothetical protein
MSSFNTSPTREEGEEEKEGDVKEDYSQGVWKWLDFAQVNAGR